MLYLLIAATTTMAPIDCMHREDFLKMVKGYGERVEYRGTAGKGQETAFEIWVNPTTKSWTTAYTDIAKDVEGKDVVRTCTPASGWNFSKDRSGEL